MTDKPLVSIITPCLNHAEFLDDTIRSVVEQDYPNIEYIVIDGGSTDGSVNIIKQHQDGISKWLSEADKGQTDAINKGFRMAKGEIVAWINSDDMYLPKAVGKAVQCFQNDPDLSVFYGDCVFVNRQGNFLRYFTEVEQFDKFRLLNCSDFIMQPTAFFRRRALFDVGLLDTSLHFTMDWDLWCRFAEAGLKFHYEPQLIAANREYGGTKTLTGGAKRTAEIRRMLRKHKTAWIPYGYLNYLRGRVVEWMRRNERRWKRCLGYAAYLGLSLASIRGVLGNRRRANRHLYGLFPHQNFCHQQARLVVPAYKTVSRAVLRLTCPFHRVADQSQQVALFINDESAGVFGFQADNTPQDIELNVAEAAQRDKKVDIRLEFQYTRKKDKFTALLEAFVLTAGAEPMNREKE